MKKQPGFTLIEMLVAMVIALLISTFVASTLILSLKYWKVIDIKSEVQLNSMVGIENLKNEIASSNIGSFTVNMASFPKAISFQSAFYNNSFRTNAGGTPSWQTYIIYYLAANSTNLLRREIYSPGPISPLLPAALTGYCNGTGTLKAFDVNDFAATIGSNYVDISIKTRLDYANKENSTNLSSRIYPRN